MTGRKKTTHDETRPPKEKSSDSNPKGRKIPGKIPDDLAAVAARMRGAAQGFPKMPAGAAAFGKSFEAMAHKTDTPREWKAQTPAEVVQDLKDGIAKTRGRPKGKTTKPGKAIGFQNGEPFSLSTESPQTPQDVAKTDARQAIEEIKLRRGNKPKRGGVSKRPGRPKPKEKSTDEGEDGRPPVLTPEVHKEIIYSISKLGMSETRAAMAADVDRTLVGKWKAKGQRLFEQWDNLTPQEQERGARYVAFFHDLRDSDTKFERVHLGRVEQASEKDFRASVKMLEWKYPLRYGKRHMIAGDPDNKTPIPVAASPADEMTDAEATARAKRILDASRAAQKPNKKG